jgi:hypothetical protein
MPKESVSFPCRCVRVSGISAYNQMPYQLFGRRQTNGALIGKVCSSCMNLCDLKAKDRFLLWIILRMQMSAVIDLDLSLGLGQEKLDGETMLLPLEMFVLTITPIELA